MQAKPAILLLLLSLLSDTAVAAVYRCVGEYGEPVFSQRPCDPLALPLELDVGADSAGAPPAGLRESERLWLQRRDAERQRRPPRPARGAPKKGGSVDDRAREAYRCARKRRDLDALNARLRRGYKASRGPALHRRQRAYRDYLSAFCS